MTGKSILFDLKPAMDGFAGIPQETRLLFRHLLGLGEGFRTDGLLQHEHEALATVTADASTLSPDQRLDASSRTVVTYFGSVPMGRLPRYRRKLRQFRQLFALRRRALGGRPLPLGHFEAGAFADFLWTRFFDKTLPAADMARVTSAAYRVLAPPRGMMHRTGLRGLPFMPSRYLTVDTRGYDFLLAQTPFPAHVSPETRLIVRYHDAVPVLMPHTIGAKDFHQASHFRALKANVDDGAVFACVSEATRNDLLRIFPQLGDRAEVIHNFISDQFSDEPPASPEALGQIIGARASGEDAGGSPPAPAPGRYLLMVATLEPRKNHAVLIEAWERLLHGGLSDLALVLVGGKGWDVEPIEALMRPWMRQGRLFHLAGVPAHELHTLYRHASATVCPSRGEGFDYSGVEAMRAGSLVIASDIPVHREIYADAAAYFDPYSASHTAAVIARLLAAEGEAERQALHQAAAGVLDRYRSDVLVPRWQRLLETSGNRHVGQRRRG